jgi:hypothetical protein
MPGLLVEAESRAALGDTVTSFVIPANHLPVIPTSASLVDRHPEAIRVIGHGGAAHAELLGNRGVVVTVFEQAQHARLGHARWRDRSGVPGGQPNRPLLSFA